MEHLFAKKLKTYIVLTIALTSCDIADMEGMFVTQESVNYRFEKSMQWNEKFGLQEINVTGEDYTLLCMGDSHIGGTVNLGRFLDSALKCKAVAVVMAGDLTSGNVSDYICFQQKIERFKELPAFLIIGNHDLYFSGWEEYYQRFGSTVYTFTIKTLHGTDLYVCLDTGSGTLGDKQLNWLKNILIHERAKYRQCVVITHNNFFRFRRTFTTTPNIEENYALIDLFTRYKVDMVVTGHDHQKHDELFGNTRYIVMDALADDQSNAGFFIIQQNHGQLSYKFENF